MTLTKEKFKTELKNIFSNKTILACIILTAIYLVGGYCKYLGLAVIVGACVCFIFFPVQNAFCLFLYLQSYCYNINGYGTYLGPTIICFVVVLFVKYCIGLKKGKYKAYKSLIISLACFLAFFVLISFFHKTFAGGYMYIVYFPLIYLMFAMRKEFNVAQAVNYLFAGFVSSCALAAVTHFLPAYKYDIFPMEKRFGAFSAHPNHIHMRAMFLLSFYIYRFLTDRLSNIKFILIYLILGIITLSCLSKTGFLMLAIFSLLFVVLFLKKDFKHNIKIVGWFALAGIVVLLVGYKFVIGVFDRFTNNSDDLLNSLLTDRLNIWKDYLKAIVKNPFVFLFGHGLLTEEVFIHSQGIPRASHNLFIFLLYRFGLFGCIALGYILYLFMKNTNKTHPSLAACLPLLWLLIIGMCENVFNFFGIIYFVLVGMIMFCDSKEKQDSPVKQKTEKIE